ncbi:hypothetical protein FOCC_FOCC016153, partial [Frankliniella occidentalis]
MTDRPGTMLKTLLFVVAMVALSQAAGPTSSIEDLSDREEQLKLCISAASTSPDDLLPSIFHRCKAD